MRLEPSERETIILFSDADDTASVYTFDKKLKARLKELHRRQPDKIYPDNKTLRLCLLHRTEKLHLYPGAVQ